MLNNAKQKLNSAKNKVVDNRDKIMGTALVLTTATAALMIRNKVVADNFLKEKGLYDEYYAMTDED
jgi:hypothetical protein